MTKESDECPAGGAHTGAWLEEPGTGKVWFGCDECGVTLELEAEEDIDDTDLDVGDDVRYEGDWHVPYGGE